MNIEQIINEFQTLTNLYNFQIQQAPYCANSFSLWRDIKAPYLKKEDMKQFIREIDTDLFVQFLKDVKIQYKNKFSFEDLGIDLSFTTDMKKIKEIMEKDLKQEREQLSEIMSEWRVQLEYAYDLLRRVHSYKFIEYKGDSLNQMPFQQVNHKTFYQKYLDKMITNVIEGIQEASSDKLKLFCGTNLIQRTTLYENAKQFAKNILISRSAFIKKITNLNLSAFLGGLIAEAIVDRVSLKLIGQVLKKKVLQAQDDLREMTNQLIKINYHLDKLIYEYYDKEERQDEIKKGKYSIYIQKSKNLLLQNTKLPQTKSLYTVLRPMNQQKQQKKMRSHFYILFLTQKRQPMMETPSLQGTKIKLLLINIIFDMEVLFNNLIQNKNNSRYKNTWLKEQASVAIIFRGDIDFSKEEKQQFKSIKNLEVLFIQRQLSPRDPHSGQIAFPGGKCEKGENDYDAAIRETLEEVGLDLIKWKAICITKLNSNAFVRITTKRKLLYCSAYVFLVHDPNNDISLRVNSSEVKDVRWVPIQCFIEPQLKLKSNIQQFKLNCLKKWTNACLLSAVNIGMDEVLCGLSFYFIVAVFIKMRDERFTKIIQYAQFFEFSFKGPLKVPLTVGYNCLFKYNRISIIENNYYRHYLGLVVAFILFLWIYL